MVDFVCILFESNAHGRGLEGLARVFSNHPSVYNNKETWFAIANFALSVESDRGNASSDPDVSPTFESPEHVCMCTYERFHKLIWPQASIGNSIVLNFPNSKVRGSELGYVVKNTRLSFGEIIALAADYFYHWKIGPCYPSISDDWDSNPTRSREIAADSVNLLQTDWEGFLEDVLAGIHEQGNIVKKAAVQGKDTAQVYKDIASRFDNYFTGVMKLGYAVIALCNPDHFGKDAERAYSSVHDVALDLAMAAGKTKDEAMLKKAYFTDAYAQHYLTDMFAAGHIRPPRRVLHSESLDGHWMPGDRCTQKQHDEDGANGLWVTNKRGDSWSCYGDKQFAQGRSAKNRQMVRSACQTSVDEIWTAFQTGVKPKPSNFEALQLTPLPDLTFGPTNFVPLFQISPNDKSKMLYRASIDARQNGRSLRKLELKQTNAAFLAIQQEIEAAGAAINMHVFTKAFSSDQQVLHLQAFDLLDSKGEKVDVVANLYGQVDAGDDGQNWGMVAQGILSLPRPTKKLSWNSVKPIGEGAGLFSLVGTQAEGDGKYGAIHVGVAVEHDSKGQAKLSQIWSEHIGSGSRSGGCTETIYGQFDNGIEGKTMVKYFEGDSAPSLFEFWKLDVAGSTAPRKYASEVPTKKLNFLLGHRLANGDSYDTVVGLAGGALRSKPSTWYFASIENGTLRTNIVEEPNRVRAQALLSHPNGSLVRLSYGSTFPPQQKLQIEIITLVRAEDGNISISASSSPPVDITWHGLIEKDYRLWFLHDVDGDGILDLVAYCSDASLIFIDVVVFPGSKDGTFKSPVVSPIVLDSAVGRLFTAEFMKPLYTTQARYTYPGGGNGSTSGAIMSFFENYGIVGCRIVVPVGGGRYTYMLGGQDGAIAGQRALTLGTRPADWMGRPSPAQPIGITVF